jgi:hypothetical protein
VFGLSSPGFGFQTVDLRLRDFEGTIKSTIRYMRSIPELEFEGSQIASSSGDHPTYSVQGSADYSKEMFKPYSPQVVLFEHVSRVL